MRIDIKNLLQNVGQYFNLAGDREDEQEVIRQVSAGVVFRGTNLWILIFAILIASLGLNVNSTAVIIGAMLVSPLMGPIIGMGLAVGISDYDLLRRALKNYAIATLISVVTAAVYFLISPLGEARSELLARTSPTLYDVLIAFCGGAAGVLALTTKSKGQVIPGVAIATALMPPLCTAGYGLATAQWSYFFGAFYLFFINTVFIALSTFLGVKLLRFHTQTGIQPEMARRGKRMLTAVVVLTMLPAAYMTWHIVRDDVQRREVARFVDHELQQAGTKILSHEVLHDTLRVVAVGRPISDAELDDARSRIGYYKLRVRDLSVIQASDAAAAANAASSEVARLHSQLAAARARLAAYTRYDTLSAAVTAEARLLFADVADVSLGLLDGRPTALVRLADDARLAPADRQKLLQWLPARAGHDDLEIIVRQDD